MGTKEIIKFTRQKDFIFKKELGQGACGRTVLLRDDVIKEDFVCKKYVPYNEELREQLFENFLHEIKLLHKVNHINIVRVFNYYLYPKKYVGYILMEFVDGTDINRFVKKHPEKINEVFLQTIKGFSYLESKEILHRDIRPFNIMVTNNGIVKIIDFGFGKQITKSKEFGKSISLNWWCETPDDFSEDQYNFSTEVYFVGKLFEKIILENKIGHFSYNQILLQMCKTAPKERTKSFSDIETKMLNDRFDGIPFSEEDVSKYREFADRLTESITKIKKDARYCDEIEIVENCLDDLYQGVMLENTIPDCSKLTRCFIVGEYFYHHNTWFEVSILKSFIDLLRASSVDKKNIILRNIHSKLDAHERYIDKPFDTDDIPF